MMIRHCVIMASAYSIGKRMALDYYAEDVLPLEKIQQDLDYIREKCGDDVPISTHYTESYEMSWNSLKRTDRYFSGVKLIKTKEEFVQLLLKDRELTGVDVAKYILAVVPCTHLKLQKLVYMCYADYLCQENSRLFQDVIYAYRYGPVVESVYIRYKRGGTSVLQEECSEDNDKLYDESRRRLPVRSRILVSKDGVTKLFSIDNTLEKYGNMTASELVNLTHQELSPWNQSGKGLGSYCQISDDIIKKYHVYEERK